MICWRASLTRASKSSFVGRERDRHGEREVDTRDHVDPVGGEAGEALVHAAAERVGKDDDLVSARKSRLDRRVEPSPLSFT